MSWRPDEIWLDTDVLWFRERSSEYPAALAANAPSFFRVAGGLIPAVTVPNGLAESRRRRAELRRRRTARRTRAAALAIGPAVMLALATPRLSSGSRTAEALREDPPSETLRPSEVGAELAGASPTGGDAERAARTADAKAKARAKASPKIHWHRATSYGLHYAGSLSAGTKLPLEGPNWVTWNPVEDSVPNRPHRLYGNERTIRAIVSVVAGYREANPDAPRVVVGDISFRGGGPMDQHRSHQNGLDVDVYYPRRDRTRRPASSPAGVMYRAP